MSKPLMLFALAGTLTLCLAGCGGEEPKQAAQPAAAPTAKPAEEKVEIYELTKDDLTTHSGWTSRNISVMGVKLGDKTNQVQDNFGKVENTRNLPKTETEPGYYLTVYQGQGLFVYTAQLTGKARKIEVNQAFAKKIADEKLQKLLTSGDLKMMRDLFGKEEGDAVQNKEDDSTEYPYDSRGFRFVKFKVKGQTLNAIRFTELEKKRS